GLLENFLEHEMFKAALFGRYGIPGDVMDLRLDRISLGIADLHTLRCQDGNVSIGEEKDVPCVREDPGNIACDKVFVLTEADDHRRAVAGGDDFVWVLGASNHQGVDPP